MMWTWRLWIGPLAVTTSSLSKCVKDNTLLTDFVSSRARVALEEHVERMLRSPDDPCLRQLVEVYLDHMVTLMKRLPPQAMSKLTQSLTKQTHNVVFSV